MPCKKDLGFDCNRSSGIAVTPFFGLKLLLIQHLLEKESPATAISLAKTDFLLIELTKEQTKPLDGRGVFEIKAVTVPLPVLNYK